MANLFREPRNVELSTVYYLETEIVKDWTGISIVKSFKEATKATLPVVCVTLLDNNPTWREIGSHVIVSIYGITIDIYATSNGQRLDLADYILNKIRVGWVYYEHSQTVGDPDSLTRTANGRVELRTITEDTKLDFGDDVDSRDKFRHSISCQVRVS